MRKLFVLLVGALLLAAPSLTAPASAHAVSRRSVTYCGTWDRLYVSQTKRMSNVRARGCFRIATQRNGSARMTTLLEVKAYAGLKQRLTIQGEWQAYKGKKGKGFVRKEGNNGAKGQVRTIQRARSHRLRTYTFTLGSTGHVPQTGSGTVFIYLGDSQVSRSGKTTKGYYYGDGVHVTHRYEVSSKRR